MWLEEQLEQELMKYPILQYAVLDTSQVSFLDRVRVICQQECPRYGTSWSCPPAVGTVEECKARCRAFEKLFVFSTIAEVNDITNLEETLATRREHERITREVETLFQKRFGETLTRSPRHYSVAAITALMVCIRFSASSNTTDWLDSKTSSVTSMALKPNFS